MRAATVGAPKVAPEVVPSNLSSPLDGPALDPWVGPDCIGLVGEELGADCVRGRGALDVVVLGDSHGGHWGAAFDDGADELGATVVPLIQNDCIPLDIGAITRADGRPSPECSEWRGRAEEYLRESTPDMVSAFWSGYVDRVPGAEASEVASQERFHEGLKRLQEVVGEDTQVVVVADTPYSEADPLRCLAGNLDLAAECVMERPAGAGAAGTWKVGQGIHVVDPTSWLCTDSGCFGVSDDTLLYRDADHLTPEAAERVSPLLVGALARVAAR